MGVVLEALDRPSLCPIVRCRIAGFPEGSTAGGRIAEDASPRRAKVMSSHAPDSEHAFVESAAGLIDASFLEELRAQMHRFAKLQLNDIDLAEDVVQEALMGALRNATSFGGRAALKTWMFAILKNKIADALRQRSRLVQASSLLDSEEVDLPPLFNEKGAWRDEERPQNWGDPEASFDQQQFWRVFETCLDGLPERHARVFMMREFIELSAEEICRNLDISASNLHVTLHRARLRLRECLENHWYAAQAPSC
jgi:RNA polymerase sigma-70 factor (TIGR02943 family)